jgi:phage gp29-like protein
MYEPIKTNGNRVGPLYEEMRQTKVAELYTPLVQRTVRYTQSLDSYRRYLTDAPTPEKIRTTLKSVDDGDLAAMVELCEEIEAKDLHLQGVATRRREALTALDWYIDPDGEEGKAEQMAEYCEEQLRLVQSNPMQDIVNFSTALRHMASGIGPGLAAFETLWFRGRPIGFVIVPGDRFTAPTSGKPDIHVYTADNWVDGEPACSPKFVVHTPHLRSGYQMRVTLIRATAWLWCIKHYAIADWAAFSERVGGPWRDVTFQPGTSPEERTQVELAVRDMGNDAYIMHSDKIALQLLEANKSPQPFDAIVTLCDNKMSIGWLGQTLTTEQQTVGSLALGQVSDMEQESETIREQLLAPMCRFRFPNVQNPPIPHFRRRKADTRDLEADRVTLDKLRYMDDKGLPVDKEFVYESFLCRKKMKGPHRPPLDSRTMIRRQPAESSQARSAVRLIRPEPRLASFYWRGGRSPSFSRST